jgi:GH24 family phage-related lysozyme (muramidase)
MAHNDKVLEEEEQGGEGEARCLPFYHTLSLPQVVMRQPVTPGICSFVFCLGSQRPCSSALQRMRTAMCHLCMWVCSASRSWHAGTEGTKGLRRRPPQRLRIRRRRPSRRRLTWPTRSSPCPPLCRAF